MSMLSLNYAGRVASLAMVLVSFGIAQAQAQSADDVVPPPIDGGLEAYVQDGVTAKDPMTQMQDQAFKSVVDTIMPMRPDQIDELARRMTEMEETASTAVNKQLRPKAVSKVESVSLDPSGEPPAIKLADGYVTTVMVLDATGAPWPIEDIGYVGKFDLKVPPKSPHVLRIVPLSRFEDGNITIQLRGLDTPVLFRVVADAGEVYYRYDVRVPEMGPKARAPQFKSANTLAGGNAVLTAVLNGYPPAGAKRLEVIGLDDRSGAWDVGGQTYLRTPYTLLSPAWSNSTRSGDGTTVYVIPDTPVLLLSDNGVMVRARLQRPEGLTGGEVSE